MHVHRRRVAEKIMDRRKIEKPPPSSQRRAAKDNLGNMSLVHDLGHLRRDFLALGLHDLRPEIFGKADVSFKVRRYSGASSRPMSTYTTKNSAPVFCAMLAVRAMRYCAMGLELMQTAIRSVMGVRFSMCSFSM